MKKIYNENFSRQNVQIKASLLILINNAFKKGDANFTKVKIISKKNIQGINV